MKKLLTVLVLVLALCGCGNNSTEQEKENNTPAGLTTLDVPTYVAELGNTAFESIKLRYVNEEGNRIEGRLTAEDSDVRTSLSTELNKLVVTKSSDQSKIYETPTLYIDLNAVTDANYARVAIYDLETVKVVVLTNDGFVNYDLSADANFDSIVTIIVDYFTEAE